MTVPTDTARYLPTTGATPAIEVDALVAEVCAPLRAHGPLQARLDAFADAAAGVLGARSAVVYLVPSPGAGLEDAAVAATYGVEHREGLNQTLDLALAASLDEDGRAVEFPTAASLGGGRRWPRDQTLAVPLAGQDAVHGALLLVRERGPFGLPDRAMAEGIGEFAGGCLHAARAPAPPPDALQVALSHVADAVELVDADGRLVFVNAAFEHLFGVAAHDVIGRSWTSPCPPSGGAGGRGRGFQRDQTVYADIWKGVMDGHTWRGDLTEPRAGGVRIVQEVTVTPRRDEKGAVVGVVAVRRDMTFLRHAEAELAQKRHAAGAVMKVTHGGMFEWDLVRSAIHYSTRWKELLGWEEADIGGKPSEWFDRVHPDELNRLKLDFDAFLGGRHERFRAEHRLLHRDGSWRWMSLRVVAERDATGRARRLVACHTDISEQREAEDRLRHRATHDALTGLPNRALFLDRVNRIREIALRRRDLLYAVLFVDLDRFKAVNDTLGHAAGDQVLKEAARRLIETIRTADTVARLGGDEFTVLLADVHGHDEALEVSRRLQDALTRPYRVGGREVHVGASIGIAMQVGGESSAQELLRAADSAMYVAKSSGGNQSKVYDTEEFAPRPDDLALQSALIRDLRRDAVDILYEPVYRLDTAQVTGLRVVPRWRHREHGELRGESLYHAVQRCGADSELHCAVADRACAQLVDWQERLAPATPVWLSLRATKAHVLQGRLAAAIVASADRAGVALGQLRVEFPEHALAQHPAPSLAATLELSDAGIGCRLVDVGADATRLKALSEARLDCVEISQELVADLGRSNAARVLVRGVAELTASLSMAPAAAGVMDMAAVAQLRDLGFRFASGEAWSGPIPAEQAAGLVWGS